MTLYYLGTPSVFRWVSMSVIVKRRKHRGSRGWRDAGPLAKQCGQPLEAEKGKGMNFPREPPEGRRPC